MSKLNNKFVIVAGMSRAGTTFLYHNLKKHPDFCTAPRKEINFFANNFNKGVEWYYNFFKPVSDDQVIVDFCGFYFSDREAIKRILEFENDVKIIIGVRKPVDWIISFYEQLYYQYDDSGFPDFNTFLDGVSLDREGNNIIIDYNNSEITKSIKRYKSEFNDNLLLYNMCHFLIDSGIVNDFFI